MFDNSGVYLKPSEECPYHPKPHFTSQGRCFSGLDLCPTPRAVQFQTQSRDEPIHTFKCSEVKPRPNDQEIRELYCSQYHFCNSFGAYEGTQELCRNFFQCYQNERGYWEAELRHCLGTSLYSFDLDKCLPPPEATDLCRSP
ncbi:uncharacterized protein LOC135226431 [Macrobrachium nipponense]|uniref:uncharacterized protein LOC135226431 n=1 Tax=Macrobrachium nipponense TaxID=159736 RepID=UPI0030C7F3E7